LDKIKDIYQLFIKYPVISTDSRTDLTNSIFFAIKGDNFDGNAYALKAIEKGAAYAIVDDQNLTKHPKLILVDNSLNCLQKLATHHRKQLNIPIIAVSGSNGKTTTKELITLVLQKKYKVFATPGNLNNHIGLPLSLLQINAQHEIAILELGANHIGENKMLIDICLPSHGIVTNIGKDHMGEFGSWEGIVEAYKEILDYFNQDESCTFFLNTDDTSLTSLVKSQNVISYSYKDQVETHIKGNLLNDELLCKVVVKSSIQNEKSVVSSKLFGSYNIYNILAAWAIGEYFQIESKLIIQALENYNPKNNRSQIIKWKSNTLIFDAYNANPSSLSLALHDFGNLAVNNKSIIFGDMHELGAYSKTEHENIIKQLSKYNFNHVMLVGKYFTDACNNENYLCFPNVLSLQSWMKNQKFKDAYILLKGSRSEQIETAFEGIL
jgi:UDP-N-acetylmuramoyl-tripeptide--D-alanyl-D-alanine ligase